MARIDREEYCQTTGIMGITDMVQDMEDSPKGEAQNGTTIHSGQFMVSCLSDAEADEDEGSEGSESIARQPVVPDRTDRGFDFQNAAHEPRQNYNFGGNYNINRAKCPIDGSLSTLFECMTLAYSGKLTSPKWKNFKGIKLTLKEKIRLNNIIWREWHMQFIYGKRPYVCHFDPPISDKTHAKPEAVVLEGKYWKRRLESVTSEYKKWRLFSKQHQHDLLREESLKEKSSLELLLKQVANSYTQRAPWQLASTRLPSSLLDPLQTDDDDSMDFSDTLFTMLNQQNFTFPNPREMSGLGNADIMQPGLVQLQPNFDDFMDTIDVTGERPRSGVPADMLSSSMSSRVDPSVANAFGLPLSVTTTATPTTTFNSPASTILPTTQNNMTLDSDTLNSAITSGLFGDTASILDVQPPASPSPLIPPSPQIMSASIAIVPDVPQNIAAQNINYQTSQIIRLILQQHQQGQQPSATVLSNQHSQAQSAQQTLLQSAHQLQGRQLQQRQLQETQLQQAQIQQSQLQQQHAQLQQNQLQQQQLQHTQLQHTQLQQTQLQQTQLQQTQLQQRQLHQSQLQQAQLQQQLHSIQHQPLLPKSPAVQLVPAVTEATMVAAPQTVTIIQNSSQLHSLLQSLNSHVPPVMNATQSVLDTATLAEAFSQGPHLVENNSTKDAGRRASTGSVNALSRPRGVVQKEGDFLVPQKPVTVRSKQRNLAPAPPIGKPAATNSPIVKQNTFLAQLLTGPYQNISPGQIKRDEVPKSAMPVAVGSRAAASTNATFMPIQPAIACTSPVPQQRHNFPVSTVSATDFQRSVLLAAAVQAPSASPLNDPFISVPSPSPPSQSTTSAPGSPSSPGNNFCASSPSYSIPSPGSDFDPGSSPGKPLHLVKNDGERHVYRENRRVSHITAEQKRRYNIKEGFDTLHQLVPSLKSNPNSKISKAATLSKTAEFCRKLKEERAARQQQTELLRQEIEALNTSISMCQQQLPATGAPVTRQHADQMRDMFDDYVRTRTLENWKFWIFSIIIRPLFESYNNMVSTSSIDDLCRTVLTWLEQHCSLVALRPGVLNSLCHLSTTTSILSDPDRVAEQAMRAVLKTSQDKEAS